MYKMIYPHLVSCIWKSLKLLIGVIIFFLFIEAKTYAQGELIKHPAGTTGAYWGYLEYLPSGYNNNEKFPLLISLHGIGEKGNGTSELGKVLNQGIPKLINMGKWPNDRPFVVVAPQSYGGFFNDVKLHEFINYLKSHYKHKIDIDRIYLTGLSAGAFSIWGYIENYQDQVAAVIPIAGNGITSATNAGCTFKKIPIWAFHGSNDNTAGPNGSIYPINLINDCNPAPKVNAKLTIYSGVGHDSWTRTYDLSGMNNTTDPKYDLYNVSIYDWLLSHRSGNSVPTETPVNQPPSVDVGEDKTVMVSENSVKIIAECNDPDGQIVSYQWEKQSGPDANLMGSDEREMIASNLQVGDYMFSVTVKDDQGATAQDHIQLTVKEEVASSPAPQDCGCDHVINLNQNFNIVNASDFNYEPGDVFCISAGSYNGFRFVGFKGTTENPVIFKNCGGLVEIQEDTYSGIHFQRSQYVHLTGTGSEGVEYGIHVSKTKIGISGISVSDLSSDFEIDHVEISNTGYAGLVAKTDPQCDLPETWRENFVLKNLSIHHNYIHDTGGEGMYIGGTFGYSTSKRKCEGIERFAHLLENVKVYDNLVEDTGWDGIQVNLVHVGAEIYNNIIKGFGKEKEYVHNQGMSIGAIRGKVYNNKIIQKPEYAIDDQQGISAIDILTDTHFFNNLIVGPGGNGIWMHIRMTDKYVDLNKNYSFLNNTIIQPGRAGIFYNTCIPGGGGCREYIKNVFYNNLIIDPGYNYENSGFWKTADEAFIDFNTKEQRNSATKSNNIFSRDMASIKFVDAANHNYNIKDGSLVIDAGKDVSNFGVTFDLNGKSRPSGKAFDVGAYEFGGSTTPGPTNQAPTVNAGEDLKVKETQSSVKFTCQAKDSDGQIVSYRWKKLSGPSANLQGVNGNEITVSSLSVGTYEFSVTVTDDDGANAQDKVKLIVEEEPIEPPTPTPGDESNGLAYKYYEGSWDKLPDFSKLNVVKEGTVSNFNLSSRNRNDKFGFRFDGYIEITKAGEYTFYTTSDDGSKLFINGKQIVDNNGLHASQERSGKITLSAGYHKIKVKYFEKSGQETLAVKYAGPGISKQSIPNGKLFVQNPSEEPPTSSGEPGLAYKYYEGSWSNLPDFSKMNPIKTGKVSTLSLSPRNRNDNFAFVFEGNIQIDTEDTYTFYLSSDDGSKLFINNSLIVNNDGLHASREKQGQVYLKKGLHPIKVTFFERMGSEILILKYSSDKISKRNLPESILLHDVDNDNVDVPEILPPTVASSKVYINFGKQDNAPSPWNNTAGDPRYVKDFTNLLDESGVATDINLSILTGWGNNYLGSYNDKGVVTGDNSGIYPDNVMKTAYWIGTNVIEKIKVGGLEPEEKYTFTFFASRVGTGDRTTKYTIGDQTVSLNASSNSSETVSITSLANNTGEVLIEVQKAESASYGYLNSLVIERISNNQRKVLENEKDAINISDNFSRESNEIKINVFPNPVSDRIYIDIINQIEGNTQVSILDLSGFVLYNETFEHESKVIDFDISKLNLPFGMYILSIISDGESSKIIKFIKN